MKPILTILFSLLARLVNGTKSVGARLIVFGFGFPFRGRKGLAAPILTILFSLLARLAVMGQEYDAQWALGYNESVVDFRTSDTVKIDSLPTFIYFILTNASICDANGNLLYYTNGVNICGLSGILSNGSGLSPCPSTDDYSFVGLEIPQATLFIPNPDDSSKYYLFHFSNDAPDSARPWRMYHSVIDKNGNGGLGAVIEKNAPIFQGQQLRGGGMTACKHANGRDYWLVMGASAVNTFYKFLVTPDTILGPFAQSIGCQFPGPWDLAYGKFSQDGSKFVTSIASGAPILVMDFDRCTGDFSNPITIFNKSYLDTSNTLSGAISVEFSPNGDFLYASNPDNLVQFDLGSLNYQDSTELFRSDSSDQYGIDMLQLAPNGKLYASTWNGGLEALHVINNPDLKGDSSGFVYGGQPTYSISSWNLPNLINYKLGPLIGSGCDTIPTGIIPQTISSPLRILPNPANKYAYMEMGMQGNYQLDLLNATGQLISTKQTKQVDIFDTGALSAGVYFVRVIDKTTGAEVTTKKLVIVH